MSQSKAMDRMKKARAKMLIKHPFFATLMMSMPMVETKQIETAATDMKSLYVNPDFIETLDDKVIMFVVAHEIMHTALVHGLRQVGRDKTLWNIATDYAINLILKESGFELWSECLIDPKYKDMGADAIYNLLKQEEEQKQKQQGQGGQGQPDPNAPPPPGSQGQSQGQQGQQPQQQPGTGQPGGEHYSPMLGDLMDPIAKGDKAAEDRLRKDIQQRVAQAAQIARMTGNMPGALDRFVDQVLEPKVPWQDVLAHLMTEFDAVDDDWSVRNRRFQRIYLPSERAEARLGSMIGIGDTWLDLRAKARAVPKRTSTA